MRNKERILLIGVLRRFYNMFAPRDLEIYTHDDKYYSSDANKHFRYVRSLSPSKLKKEMNWQLENIHLWRVCTKKDWWIDEYIEFLTD